MKEHTNITQEKTPEDHEKAMEKIYLRFEFVEEMMGKIISGEATIEAALLAATYVGEEGFK